MTSLRTILWSTLWGIALLVPKNVYPQHEEPVELDPVVIHALPFEKFAPGSKVQKPDSLAKEMAGQGSLADLLMQNSTVYIKEHGNRMLASIAFRGTGASHTGVYWHGINLNALTLGQSDFNNVNLFLFDDLVIQYGGAASLHGSDAIGGSVHLRTAGDHASGTAIRVRQDVGSFGNWFSGIKADIGHGKWSASTRAYHFKLQNDFVYTITDRLGEPHNVTQDNAAVHDYAVLQELHYRPNFSNHFSIRGWYQHNDQEVQPSMVSHPEEDQTGADLLDNNLRLLAGYRRVMRRGQLDITLGYVHDDQRYDGSERIETRRLQGIVDQEFDVGRKTVLKIGANTQYIRPDVHSYADDVSEWRTDLYASIEHDLRPDWQMAVNVRRSMVPDMDPPIAPSIGTQYRLKSGASAFEFRAQAERSYRIPTLNDRYWGRGGRKDLRAEYGYSTEIGHKYSYDGDGITLEADVAAYVMTVDDWIAWRPEGNLWRPFNLKKVQAHGVELGMKLQTRAGPVALSFNGQYAWNRSVLKRGTHEGDAAVDYQLPYTPQHRGVLAGHIIFQSWRLSAVNQYTGLRRGQDVINDLLDPYLITNLSLNKTVRIGAHTLTVEGQVLNAFDISYQNMRRYAMPGRNYLVSVRYGLNP